MRQVGGTERGLSFRAHCSGSRSPDRTRPRRASSLHRSMERPEPWNRDAGPPNHAKALSVPEQTVLAGVRRRETDKVMVSNQKTGRLAGLSSSSRLISPLLVLGQGGLWTRLTVICSQVSSCRDGVASASATLKMLHLIRLSCRPRSDATGSGSASWSRGRRMRTSPFERRCVKFNEEMM